ncbi:MAG: tRNA guanosine(15) transglycosylase TgtA [Candidatus Thalassarchaeaceae archaeon]|jgi:7-cyano-7-deazaguanine tRNA-ribosyltransferase|nr:tRNA guanosine(15) transglycosylase TgtA [Candidatus Thalassarchaeaceae archaeon]
MTGEAKPCRDGDHAKFEVVERDGWARLGRLHTSRHILNTPTLLPVINPNIRTVEPREMWENYGFEAIITNSYVIWKHDHLKVLAQSDGVHALLDYPGVIMTDSGTFQNYVYGDVEVGVEEIVKFQREIDVDIATMLDVFATPKMSYDEVEAAVDETVARSKSSIEAAQGTMLNGPIQGGTFSDLRMKSATEMANFDFAVHPIGGIVPLMERQRYRELVEVILACREHIPWERPIHMFGCGHPHLFPICVALGADLFDSAAYALFARDDRMLMPWGTVKLAELTEFPISTAALAGHTPDSVRSLGNEERCKVLAKHNLEITASELARCREAVRNGTIWKLVEERSHTNAALREATEYLYQNLPLSLIEATNPLRSGGVSMSNDLAMHPHSIACLGRLLSNCQQGGSDAIIYSGSGGPWRERIAGQVQTIHRRWPNISVFIETPLGLIPYSVEDVSPWAHINGPRVIWNEMSDDDLTFDLDAMLEEVGQILHLDVVESKANNIEKIEAEFGKGSTENEDTNRLLLDRSMMIDKVCYFLDISQDDAISLLDSCTFVYSKTKRVRNVHASDGEHILSPRLKDGGLSLTLEGAKRLHGKGMATVVVHDDSIPFTRKGRNVMHGFIVSTHGQLTPGLPCLIEDQKGTFLGHGVAQCTESEALGFRKGIAVKVRDGVGE